MQTKKFRLRNHAYGTIYLKDRVTSAKFRNIVEKCIFRGCRGKVVPSDRTHRQPHITSTPVLICTHRASHTSYINTRAHLLGRRTPRTDMWGWGRGVPVAPTPDATTSKKRKQPTASMVLRPLSNLCCAAGRSTHPIIQTKGKGKDDIAKHALFSEKGAADLITRQAANGRLILCKRHLIDPEAPPPPGRLGGYQQERMYSRPETDLPS